MSTLAASGPTVSPGKNKLIFPMKIIGFTALLAVAVAFVGKYVFRYYLHYNQSAFTDPQLGAANYWAMRGWLMLHISAGMVALLTGPWQFWTGFRARYLRLHRWTGRLFLGAVALGSLGGFRLAIGTTFGWAFGFGLIGLASAWFGTAAIAYYAILRGNVAVHKEWMVRAYVVTFAFVTFRVLNDYGLLSRFQPDSDRSITLAWACWVIPLMLTEVILQLRRLGKTAPSLG
jgi:uncharacterized membrane protein YozB (DUF420 family)